MPSVCVCGQVGGRRTEKVTSSCRESHCYKLLTNPENKSSKLIKVDPEPSFRVESAGTGPLLPAFPLLTSPTLLL